MLSVFVTISELPCTMYLIHGLLTLLCSPLPHNLFLRLPDLLMDMVISLISINTINGHDA